METHTHTPNCCSPADDETAASVLLCEILAVFVLAVENSQKSVIECIYKQWIHKEHFRKIMPFCLELALSPGASDAVWKRSGIACMIRPVCSTINFHSAIKETNAGRQVNHMRNPIGT